MKKILAGALIAAFSTVTMAEESGPGCGVGSMIFKGQSGVAPHVLAATTNGLFGNNTFGMTSGTLGCNPNKAITIMAAYMDHNMDKVARDMSRGEGENLDSLAVLLGVEKADRDHFAQVMKSSFGDIFKTDAATSVEVAETIAAIMQSDEKLAKYIG